MSDKAKSVAALIVNSLGEQSNESGYVRTGINADGSDDLTEVCIDGYYDILAIAEAVVAEVRNGE